MTAEEFYRERDRRTQEYGVITDICTAPVRVQVADDAAESPRGQALVLALINLLARFHRHLVLAVPRRALISARPLGRVLAGEHADLRDAAYLTATAIDPHINIEFDVDRPELPSVGIGKCERRSAAWYLNTIGNIVELSPDPQPADSLTGFALGPCLGACIGAWALLRQVVGEPLTSQRLSAWSLRDGQAAVSGPPHLGALDIGRCIMVGAGGVGSCLAYWLAQAGVVGPWTVVDGDLAELHNTNRCMGILPAECGWQAGMSMNKAVLAAELFGAQAQTRWYHELDEQNLRADLILPLANERGVRTAISQRGEPVLLHATTSRAFEAQLHRHIPERDDCLLCRMPSRQLEPTFGCSSARIGTSSRQGDAALAFLSGTAALMLMSALYRLSAGELEGESANFFRLVFRSVGGLVKSGRCACRRSCPGGLPRSARLAAKRGSRWVHVDRAT